jgi:hypothetical protein
MTCSYLIYLQNRDETRPDRTDEWVQAMPHRGDIVAVRDNGERWGRLESKQEWVAAGGDPAEFSGLYGVVKVSDDGPHAEDLKKVFERRSYRPAVLGENEYRVNREGVEFGKVLQYKFAWRVRISEMTSEQQAALEQDGVVSVTETEFEALCEHKVDRTYFDPAVPDGKGAVRPDAGQPLPREEVPVRGRPNG